MLKTPPHDFALVAAVLAAYLATSRGLVVGDNMVHVDAAIGLAQRGSPALAFDPGPGFSAEGRGGRRYSLLGPGYAIIVAPAVWLGGLFRSDPALHEQMQQAFGSSGDHAAKRNRINRDSRVVAVCLFQALAGALTVLLFLLIAREFGWSAGTSRLGAAALAFCTPLFSYSGACWTQPIATLLLTAAFLALLRAEQKGRRRHLVFCGTALGLACLVRLELAILAIPLVVACTTSRRAPSLVLVGGPWLLGIAMTLAWHAYFLGALVPGSVSLSRLFDHNPVAGLVGLLLSPKAGVVYYAPLALLAPWGVRSLAKKARGATLAAGAVVVGHFLVYGAWYQWHAPLAWGPRYLAPCLPLLLVFASEPVVAARRRERTYRGLMFLGFLSQLPGALVAGYRLPSGYGSVGPWSPLSYLAGWGTLARGVDCRSLYQWSYRIAAIVATIIGALLWRKGREPRRA